MLTGVATLTAFRGPIGRPPGIDLMRCLLVSPKTEDRHYCRKVLLRTYKMVGQLGVCLDSGRDWNKFCSPTSQGLRR
jgi:hypothetical protein